MSGRLDSDTLTEVGVRWTLSEPIWALHATCAVITSKIKALLNLRENEPAFGENVKVSSLGKRISIDSQVCEGKATAKGTRMTVEFVLKLFGAGYTAADVVREYPILGPEDVYECATFGT